MLSSFLLIFLKINSNFFKSNITSQCQTILGPDQVRYFVGPDLGPKCLLKVLSDGSRGGLLEPPTPPPVLKYPMKMK